MLGARPGSQICPVPEKFYYGCLRHDFMWRTMAVLDQATGRVWNERNRFVADQMFLTDHQIYCAFDNLDNPNLATNMACLAAAKTYHLGVRTGAGFRENLADSERNSVTYGHDDYVSGLVPAPAANCGLRSNRCLPINYLEYEGKPLVPKGLASIPQGVVLEMQLVRANQYAVKGPPVNRIITDPFDDGWRKTGEIRFSAHTPFMVGKMSALDCTNQAVGAGVYVDSGEYPIPANPDGTTPPPDTEIKRTSVFVKACLATTGEQEAAPQLEMYPVEARRELGMAGFVKRAGGGLLGGRVRHYQDINAIIPAARMTPDPSRYTIAAAGTWYGPVGVLETLDDTDRVKVIANPDDPTPLAEIARSSTTINFCPAETNDPMNVSNGTQMKVAMCGPGTGIVELRHPDEGYLLNRYVLRMGAPPPPPSTCDEVPLTHGNQTVRHVAWSTQDCYSVYRPNSYIDYYSITPAVSGTVTIRLESTENTYLLLYEGSLTTGAPWQENDDHGTGANSQITVNMTAGTKYIIGATTNVSNITGSYTLSLTMPTVPQPTTPSTTAGGPEVPPGGPSVNAGSDQTVSTGATVSLIGTGSPVNDDDDASYSWTQQGTTTVNLTYSTGIPYSSGLAGNSARFTAPSTAGTLVFRLTVTDHGTGICSWDELVITVS